MYDFPENIDYYQRYLDNQDNESKNDLVYKFLNNIQPYLLNNYLLQILIVDIDEGYDEQIQSYIAEHIDLIIGESHEIINLLVEILTTTDIYDANEKLNSIQEFIESINNNCELIQDNLNDESNQILIKYIELIKKYTNDLRVFLIIIPPPQPIV